MTIRPDLAAIIERLPPRTADALAAFLACCSVETAFRPAPPTATRRDRLDGRDEAIRDLAARHFADTISAKARAVQIRRELCVLATMPSSQRGATGRRAALFGVLALCGGKVPGQRQVESILSGERTPFRSKLCAIP